MISTIKHDVIEWLIEEGGGGHVIVQTDHINHQILYYPILCSQAWPKSHKTIEGKTEHFTVIFNPFTSIFRFTSENCRISF